MSDSISVAGVVVEAEVLRTLNWHPSEHLPCVVLVDFELYGPQEQYTQPVATHISSSSDIDVWPK